MFRKSLVSALILVVIATAILSIVDLTQKDAMSQYGNHKKLFTRSEINPHYVGPVFSTGGAMTDINRYITDMAPALVAKFDKNSFTLFETAPIEDQIFNFKKVNTYKIERDTEEFTVMQMKGDNKDGSFEILVEIKEGANFDRTITVYKNGKRDMLILWLDNQNIKLKKADVNI